MNNPHFWNLKNTIYSLISQKGKQRANRPIKLNKN